MNRNMRRRKLLILGVGAVVILAVLFGFGVNPLYIAGRGWLPPFWYAMLGLPQVQPTPEAIAEAKRHPGGRVSEIDNRFDRNADVPPEAIKGSWKVDQNGNITGDFIPNPYFVEGWQPPPAP